MYIIENTIHTRTSLSFIKYSFNLKAHRGLSKLDQISVFEKERGNNDEI